MSLPSKAQSKVAIVTGSNKGIGFAIVKGLYEKFNGTVYLTARSVERGNEAVEKLKKSGLSPSFHQLDVDDQESVNKFRDYIKEEHGGVDILINNAAIAYNQDAKEPFYKQAADTIKTNYFGLLRVCEAFFPLLRKNARVVNVSSSAGHLSRIPSPELRARFSDPNLTVAGLSALMNEFVKCREEYEGAVGSYGWNDSAYVVLKVGVCALTRIQQRDFERNEPAADVKVNSVHPGFVDTDMTDHQGVLTVEEGARPVLYLAIGEHQLKGEYVWCDSTSVDWETENGSHETTGWGRNSYVVSKVGVSALTRIHQRLFDGEEANRGISANSVHPGYVDTDMTNHKGVLTIEEGARAPLFLALEAQNLKGQYLWYDSKVEDWLSTSTPTRG